MPAVSQSCGKAFLWNYFSVLLLSFLAWWGWLQWHLLHALVLFDLQKLYKEAYEQSRGNKMNYCETPKFQTDAALKNFSDVGISFGLYPSVLTPWITSVSQLVVLVAGKIQRCISEEYFGALLGQLWGPTAHPLHEGWSYEKWCECGIGSVFPIALAAQTKLSCGSLLNVPSVPRKITKQIMRRKRRSATSLRP